MKKTVAVFFLAVLLLSVPFSAYASGISLIIPDESWGNWTKVSTKRISFHFDVENTNPTKTVAFYEVTYYICDEYRERVGPTETVTLEQEIKPFETVTTPDFFLINSQADDVYYVYIAITYVCFSDGTGEYDYDPAYCYWTVRDY